MLRKMSTLFELFGFVLLVIETLVGMVGNGFIAIVNCIDWFRSRKLSPADRILSLLGLFRFAFLAVLIQAEIINLFFMDAVLMPNRNIASDSLWLFLNTASLWFAAWLSVLYCVKIANFSQPLFLQMKQRFPGLVPWLLLGAVVFSAITTTVAITGSKNVSKCNIYESDLSNNNDSAINTSNSCVLPILLHIFPNLFPFAIFLFSSILLLTSLWRHKNLLRNSARDVSTEVHLNAIKALASFSVLYVSNVFVEILSIVLFWMGINDNWVHLIVFNVIAAYSSGHAVSLIFMSPKLKQESIKILHQLKC
ncbi:taste receptor type 2 member 40-like [Lacerta agilis]|uniref:taste receptor type 2 member 40-like n=1 Tax=Lacerta agilis TaxID=80427 RepID=UPI0014199638|nr:taste receptor type 2 member 40-like [Lacerta agilis]